MKALYIALAVAIWAALHLWLGTMIISVKLANRWADRMVALLAPSLGLGEELRLRDQGTVSPAGDAHGIRPLWSEDLQHLGPSQQVVLDHQLDDEVWGKVLYLVPVRDEVGQYHLLVVGQMVQAPAPGGGPAYGPHAARRERDSPIEPRGNVQARRHPEDPADDRLPHVLGGVEQGNGQPSVGNEERCAGGDADPGQLSPSQGLRDNVRELRKDLLFHHADPLVVGPE